MACIVFSGYADWFCVKNDTVEPRVISVKVGAYDMYLLNRADRSQEPQRRLNDNENIEIPSNGYIVLESRYANRPQGDFGFVCKDGNEFVDFDFTDEKSLGDVSIIGGSSSYSQEQKMEDMTKGLFISYCDNIFRLVKKTKSAPTTPRHDEIGHKVKRSASYPSFGKLTQLED
jgi:hypothetical protein